MKKLQDNIGAAFRVFVVVFSLLALCSSGATAAFRAFYGPYVEKVQEPVVDDTAKLVPGPPSPEDLRGEMDSGSRPNTEQSALLTTSAVFGTAKDENRKSEEYESEGQESRYICSARANSPPLSTVSTVSSSLGRQFTLVGAKPSGTS